ncbi:unnamed protein product [Durusdinium trenchii]|uniref:DEAD/DEAH-box helicase domain-containing protein n=1 Tax=Durusdinium trenchii TaxID=1381693 RepID=A0ABP0I5I2_9DINO
MPDDLTLAWQRLRSSRETPTSGLHTTLNLAQSSRSPRRLRPTAPPEPAADLGDPRPRFPSSLAHLRVDLGPPRPTAQTVTSTSQNVEDQMLATIKERLAAVKAKEKSLEDQFDTLCTTHANLQRALQEAQDHEPQNDLKGGEEKVENEMLKKERQQADEEAASASAVQAEEEAASASASQVENETLKRDLKKAQQQAEEEAEKKKKKLEEQLEDGKRQAKDKEVENEMLKKGLQKAQQQVGAVNVTLYITLKDQPAEMADTAPKKSYPGEFRENAARCVISFPGKYPSGWDALVKGHHDSSIGCVFFTTPGERGFGDLVDPGEGGLGDHVQDPEAEEGICYCKAIYGERSWEKFHYLKKVKKENLKEELEKAKVTKIHVVEEDLYNSSPEKKEEADKEAQQKYEENKRRAPWGCAWFPAWMKNGHKAVEQGQKLQVVFFAGQKGKGKVHWNDLPGSELWNGEGLGGSQKGEVAYLDKMWRETNNPAWIYEEIDVMQFLQGEFNLEQEVDARDMAKNWRRGHIVGLPVAGAADDKEWVPKWTVQCNKDLEKFESTFLMHTVEPIDKLLKEVGKDNLSRMLEQHLPKGVDLDVMFASRCRLENGHAAFAVNVRVPHVKAIHMLRDQVLCGDLEAELNRSLADIHQSEFQVQVDKTEFFEQYESSLLSLSKLTHHQESKLRQLHQRKSKELHLTAPAGAGKTFVAVQFALDKVYENCKSEGAILYVAPRLSLCLHFVQWLIARHLWLKGRGGELEELLSRIVIMHKRDEDYVNVKLVLEGNQFAEHPAAAPEYLLAIFDEAHELFTTDEMTGIYRDLRANQKLLLSDMSQSASLRVALPEVEDTVSLSDVVRSTQRIVAAAQAFELEKSKGITTSCSGTNGPPLKTFIFEALDDAEMFHQCCRYTLDAIRHVFRSYPSLSSLHLRVAIIVPDKTFCDKFKGLLRDELTSTFTARKFQLRSFAESLRYLRSHHHDERAAGDEVLVLDTVEEARGQEMMVVICVGLDQKIADTDARKTDTLLTRARIYQGITRAQLMAIVVDKLIQGGFLQFLTTLKFNNKKFDQSFAFSEGTSKAASRIKKKAEALPSEVVEEKDGEGMDTAAMTGLSLAVVKDELGGIEQLLEVCIVKENDDGANKFISADGKAQGEIDKDGPRDDDRFETSIWDTDSNQTKSTSQTLAFDPRIDQVLGRILEELPGGESTPGLEARKEIDHTDGKSQDSSSQAAVA